MPSRIMVKESSMKFCEYIKTCREHFSLTQEELVNLLFQSNDIFSGLDAVTLSRWERCLTYPNIERQQYFIKAMQSYSHSIFPCSDSLSLEEVEKEVYEKGIQKVIGKHKRFILTFPNELLDEDAMQFNTLDTFKNPHDYLNLTYTFIKKITNEMINIDFERFEQWAKHPSSFFLIASYQRQFFGVMFSIRIKESIFNDLMHFKMSENDIKLEHLASCEEKGCEYPFTLFTYTEQTATILILRYYAHLLKHKNHIGTLGSLPKSPEGEKLISTLGLKHFRNDPKEVSPIKAYQATMEEVLLNPYALNMLFKK